MSNTERKAMTFRFRKVVRKRLAELCAERGHSATRVVEDQILHPGAAYAVPADDSGSLKRENRRFPAQRVSEENSEPKPEEPRLRVDPDKIDAFQRKMAKGKK